MNNKNLATKINFVLAALMFVYLIMTFIPCVVYNDSATSIQSYVWLVPSGVNDYIINTVDSLYDINFAVMGPIICSICAIIGIAVSLIFCKKGESAILPIVIGIVGIIDCIVSSFMVIVTLRFVFLALFVLIATLGIYNGVYFAKDYSARRKAGEF